MIELPSYVKTFMKDFRDSTYQIYLVGGAVRHLLLGDEVKNWDFATSAKPEEIIKLFPHSFYNNHFGTVGIPLEINGGTEVFEVTTFRKESGYSNVRHPDTVEWADNIKDDLGRRDFTINAIAFDGEKLTDPYGGQDDIKKRIIKAVGEPDIRFAEDALRLMRAVRQASQLGFEIEPKTHLSIQKNAHLIDNISGERVRDEFFKILLSKHPAEGILILKETHLLDHIIPEIVQCFKVDQISPERHHIYDVGTHLIESLRNCDSTDPITLFATLLHDIGKAKTYRKDEKTAIITFYNHEVVGAHIASEIADRFKLSKKDKEKLLLLIRHHQFTVSEEQSDKAIRRFIRQVGLEYIDDMLALRTADRLGSGAKETSWRTELFKKRILEVQDVPFAITDLKINGADVMKALGLKPGPKVGEILKTLFEEVDDGKLPNEREKLLSRIEQLK
jgi:putative nucleotidyltransferase with HDIG domain